MLIFKLTGSDKRLAVDSAAITAIKELKDGYEIFTGSVKHDVTDDESGSLAKAFKPKQSEPRIPRDAED
jgi:hypothetical protein